MRNEEQEIELIDYLNVIWKRKEVILGSTHAGTDEFTFLAFFLEYIEKARRAGRVREEQ